MHIKTLAIGAFALSLGAGCVSGADNLGSAPPQETFIVGGESESGYGAVVAVLYHGGQGCTGTLVNSTFVVTAAHCVEGESASIMSVFFGNNVSASGTEIDVVRAVPHPAYNGSTLSADIAVLELARPAPANITPIPYSTAPLSGRHVGQSATFVGFGLADVNNDSSAGLKRSVQIPITFVYPEEFHYAAPGKQTCFGDSGGPAFLNIDGVERLVGVTSYGDANCAEFGANIRTDAFADFLADTIGDDSGTMGDDACAAEGRYNDGTCDTDCLQPDPDCQGDVTPEEGEAPDDPAGPATDSCEEAGFYDNDVCNANCPKPDPDCFIEVCTGDVCYDIPRTEAGDVRPGDGQGPTVNLGEGCRVVGGGAPRGEIVAALLMLGVAALRRRRGADVG